MYIIEKQKGTYTIYSNDRKLIGETKDRKQIGPLVNAFKDKQMRKAYNKYVLWCSNNAMKHF